LLIDKIAKVGYLQIGGMRMVKLKIIKLLPGYGRPLPTVITNGNVSVKKLDPDGTIRVNLFNPY